jgi:hypothetical protein
MALRFKPLSWFCWALIYSWKGLNPFGFHLVNLLLHCFNTVLLFALLKFFFCAPERITPESSPHRMILCAWGALLWAIHPLRAEPVAWATGLPYGLSLVFVVSSLLFYLHWQRSLWIGNSKPVLYWAAVISFLASALAYPMAVTYPLVLLVLDLWPLRRCRLQKDDLAACKRVFMEKVPFFLITGLLIGITLYGRVRAGGNWEAPVSLNEFGLFSRMMQAFYIWPYYAWKFWVPSDLSPLYLTLCSFNPLAPLFIINATLVLGLTSFVFWKRREWPLAVTLWSCHLASAHSHPRSHRPSLCSQ